MRSIAFADFLIGVGILFVLEGIMPSSQLAIRSRRNASNRVIAPVSRGRWKWSRRPAAR